MPVARPCRRALLGLAVVAVSAATLLAAPAARAADLLVLAAASLRNAFEEVARGYEAETGRRVVFSFAASSALAKQVEQGVPADLFVSADLDWMDHVAARGLIRAETRTNLLTNRLVLVAPAAGPGAGPGAEIEAVEVAPGFPLARLLGDGRLATGDPAHVPAGKYAKTALENLRVWKEVEPRLARADSVRAALALVSRGEAPLGVVYETDARADRGVRVVGAFPPASHDPIIYPAAVLAGSTAPGAAAFLAHLASPAATAILARHGFGRPSAATN
jgi:molybdate transport system substrate-binding protein